MQHRAGKRGPMAYDINTRIALGALNAGIGQTHVNSLFSCLNVPSVNHVTFKVREREVGKAIESVAEASCLESCSEERKRAVAAGVQGDDQDLIGVLVSYDMGWQKRGKAHNSSTGHGAVLGVSTGKVLDFATRCKMCRICSAAKDKPKPHDCRKNHDGSSKIMESDVACQLFQHAPTRGIKYDKYIGDDDSTTLAQLKSKVPYGLEKISDFIHTKRSLSTRLYNLSQRQKFDNSSILSQKVINYLVKCFSYCVHQNRNCPQELSREIKSIVPHAFGNHEQCSSTWCRYKQDPVNYMHNELPHGKDLHGASLKQALQTLFDEYASETVTAKLAPCMDSQRNESLNGTIGSKNLKIRYYGGSESSEFRTACGVAQHNEGHKFVNKTLLKAGITPGIFCEKHQDKEDSKSIKDKSRKSSMEYKRRRRHFHLKKIKITTRHEKKEGPSYGHNIGLSLNPSQTNSTNESSLHILKNVNINLCKQELPNYENLIPSSGVRPVLNEISFDPQKTYTFVVFDIETASTSRTTELLQLSAITEDEKATFSEYILPSKPISSTASAIHNITVRYSGDQRQLYKDGKQIPATSLQTCLTRFLHFLKTIYNSKPVDHLVLTGHNSSVFDTPRLLRNGGSRFSNQLEEMKVLFCDSLPVFKFLRSQPNNALKSSPNNKLACVYKALFNCDFLAHDALEDVKALRRILFTPPLELSTETIVNHGKTSSPNEAQQQSTFLERRQQVVDTFNGNLYLPSGSLKLTLTTIQKLADAGLAFSTLQEIHSKFGLNGLYGIIALPPSNRNSQPSQNKSAKSPRISSNKRIISTVLKYFHEL